MVTLKDRLGIEYDGAIIRNGCYNHVKEAVIKFEKEYTIYDEDDCNSQDERIGAYILYLKFKEIFGDWEND